MLQTTHPPGWTNPVILRVSAVLELASAWDVTPIESSCACAEFITLSFTYTRSGAGSAFDWQLWTSIYAVAGNAPAGAQEWQAPAIYASGAVVAGSDTQSQDQTEYETYQEEGAAVESFTIGPISLRGTFERLRFRARESGTPVAPGTLQVTAEFS